MGTYAMTGGATGIDVAIKKRLRDDGKMRRNVVDYAVAGIRMNAVAPGYTQTPMTERVEQESTYGKAIRNFMASIPVGFHGKPDDQAAATCFLLSPEVRFICGSVLFVDGGHDAVFRPDQL